MRKLKEPASQGRRKNIFHEERGSADECRDSYGKMHCFKRRGRDTRSSAEASVRPNAHDEPTARVDLPLAARRNLETLTGPQSLPDLAFFFATWEFRVGR